MSNIEPTEEQREAAVAYCLGTPTPDYAVHWVKTGENVRTERGFTVSAGPVALARLLAEREAKLRKQLTFMEAGSLADYNAFAEALQKEDAYLAEINLINERLAEMREVDGRKSRMLYDRDVVIDTLRARVAELEAAQGDTVGCEGCGRRLPSLCAVSTEDPVYLCARCVSPMHMEREAQRLADIKALREELRHSRGAVCYWVEGSGSPSHYIKDLKTLDAVLASTAHYDDAKADAPAVVEVDDEHRNGPCGWSGCGRCGDTEGGEG